MIIPIVRRSITVRVRDTFRFPFACDVCRLWTAASVYAEGTGTATMAYLAPDENVARNNARANAYATACSLFAQAPCPRCGAHSAAQRSAVRAWEERVVSRKKVRFWMKIVGMSLSVLTGGGCGVSFVADQGLSGGAVFGAAFIAGVWIALGAGVTAIACAIASPGKRPSVLPYVPPNVVFDPPSVAHELQIGAWPAL